jgi:hypothetical protein
MPRHTMGMLTIIPPPAERRIRREARSQTLRDLALGLRQAGWTLAEIAAALGLSIERARQIVRKAERRCRDAHWSDALPARARHSLYARGLLALSEIEAVQAVAQLSRRELMRAPDFGNGTCAAIIAWLARHGLKLQPESPHAFAQRMRERDAEMSQKRAAPGEGSGNIESITRRKDHAGRRSPAHTDDNENKGLTSDAAPS